MHQSSISFIEKRVIEDISKKSFKKIITRFPPEPNGYLHLGHAKSIFFNFGLSQKYHGEFNLRFDDTNPSTEDQDYVDMIEEDLKWLGITWTRRCYASDYFENFYDYAVELIKLGKAYVDEQNVEKIRADRGNWHGIGVDSIFRNRSIKENLLAFQAMKDGKFSEGAAVLRAKIDMSAKNILMRDPILYRIKFTSHHQTKEKWVIFPTYDFAHCLSDAIEHISHSICTLEFQDNRALYDWILDVLKINPRPYQHEFARLNVQDIILSKRKLISLIEQKIVDGWDDPRMPTICAFRRRGYPAQALKLFCERLGISKQDNCVEFSALETCVREVLNESALRAMAVIDPIKLTLKNIAKDQKFKVIMQRHPFKPECGERELFLGHENFISREDFSLNPPKGYKRLSLKNTVRLRNGCVIKAEKVTADENGKILSIEAVADLESFGCNPVHLEKPKGVIHWVSEHNSVEAEFRHYSSLFLFKNVENAQPDVNPNSLKISCGVIDRTVLNDIFEQGCAVQFEREGYFYPELSKFSSIPIFHETVSLKGADKRLQWTKN